MKNTIIHKNYQYLAVILSVIASVVFVAAGVFGATTIDANISTGTLTASGAATLSSTLAVTSAATLSSTLAVTGSSTLADTLTVGSTLTVTGAATMSSTLAVTGTTAFTGVVRIATTSTNATLSVDGTATTTLKISSSAVTAGPTARGGCIEITSDTGAPYRMYIGTFDYATITSAVGPSRAGIPALWEAGHCKDQ